MQVWLLRVAAGITWIPVGLFGPAPALETFSYIILCNKYYYLSIYDYVYVT